MKALYMKVLLFVNLILALGSYIAVIVRIDAGSPERIVLEEPVHSASVWSDTATIILPLDKTLYSNGAYYLIISGGEQAELDQIARFAAENLQIQGRTAYGEIREIVVNDPERNSRACVVMIAITCTSRDIEFVEIASLESLRDMDVALGVSMSTSDFMHAQTQAAIVATANNWLEVFLILLVPLQVVAFVLSPRSRSSKEQT